MKQYISYLLFALAGMLFAWYLYLNHKRWIGTVIVRAVLSIVIIYLINTVALNFGIATLVGVNLVSIVVTAFLGVPGLLLLYGASLFF
ncbi:pro-sigmaK processing inhibitor BofA family protein [Lachnoclostridium sp.]|uniref:pro-sigmaK processing inhibitor BofA family protein n=1 Tax=Lachnoclostridium sp. TaxID=2028282 RepID=UPI0028A0858B|nr:pro-sigmaK processing inhibitor BofA family protein [Lachnoclostridium sp.]